MTPVKKDSEEEYVFEFYVDDYAESLEEVFPVIMEQYGNVDFEENLDEDQLKVINNLGGPMLIIAGAGSGKTRTITYAVAKLLLSGVSASNIMLITFTNKAAGEMIKRVETLLGKRPKGIWSGTFHSIGNRFLRMYTKSAGLKPNYTIMDEGDAKVLMKLSIDEANVLEIEERFPKSRACKNILSYSINCNKSIRDVILWKYEDFDTKKVILKLKQVFKIYAKKKAEGGLLDFDDLLVIWNRLLDEKDIAKLIAKRIKYVLVDEYQDTNYIQDEIIRKIVSQNPDQNVIAVGDDAQSIYAFRGANFQNILNFSKQYDDCKTYKITYNYRSTPQILELANDSISHNVRQYKKDMKATRKDSLKPFQVNVADDKEQARFIAQQVFKLREEGISLKDIAVLYRAGHHSLRIELELRAQNIPYEVRAGRAFFEKAHVKDLLVHLKVIHNPHDEISWSRIFEIIPGLGKKSGAKIFGAISSSDDPIETLLEKDFFSTQLKGARIPGTGKSGLVAHLKPLRRLTLEDDATNIIKAVIKIISEHVKNKYQNADDRLEDLNQVVIYAQSFPSLQKFLENLSLNGSQIESKTTTLGSKKEAERPMVLSTIHRAKGLEWRAIFIPMLSEDSFPSSRVVGDPDDMEEERRVFYVAITRAKDRLYLISPALIQMYGRFQTARLSDFIVELDSRVYKKSTVKFNPKGKEIKKNVASFTSAFNLMKEK